MYAVGHKSNRTDSVTAIIAYSYYSRLVDKTICQPVICGAVNRKIQLLLDYFHIPAPLQMTDVKPKACHLQKEQMITLHQYDTLSRAIKLQMLYNHQMYPVVDDDNHCVGYISNKLLFPPILNPTFSEDMCKIETNLYFILEALNAKLINTNIRPQFSESSLYYIHMICNLEDLDQYHFFQKTIFICISSNEKIVDYLVRHKAAIIIISYNGLPSINKLENDDDIVDIETNRNDKWWSQYSDKYEKANVPIVISKFSILVTSVLVRQAIPINKLMRTQNFTTSNQETLTQIYTILNQQVLPSIACVDDQNKLVNLITRNDCSRDIIIDIALLDVNNINLTIEGVDHKGVQIVQLVDRHPLSSWATNSVVNLKVRECASTTAIVSSLFQEVGLLPSTDLAGVMLGGILVATQNLRSPRTTIFDKKQAEFLSVIAGVDSNELFKILIQDYYPDICNLSLFDYKNLYFSRGSVSVYGMEMFDFSNLPKQLPLLETVLNKQRERHHHWCIFIMLTSLDLYESNLLINSELSISQEIVQSFLSLNYTLVEGHQNLINLGGMLSRRIELMPLVNNIMLNLAAD